MQAIDAQRAFVNRALDYRKKALATKSRSAGSAALHEQVLAEILSLNSDTEFGRLHDFARIRSIADYQRAVPIRGYDEFEGWCDRMTGGETHVLTAEPPVLFRRTTGTSGNSKRIPVTARSLTIDQQKLAIGLVTPCIRFPELVDTTDGLMLGTFKSNPPNVRTTPSGVPWITQGDHNQYFPTPILEGSPGRSSSVYVTDRPLEYPDAIYARLCNGVQTDLCGMFALNPSALISIAFRLAEDWDRITEEVRNGTVLGEARRAPNPRRADELRALGAEGRRRPRDVWPAMRFVHCWKAASCALYLPKVRELFGDIEILPFPFIASEGISAVHLDDHPTAGFLLPDGMLFEFFPLDANDVADTASPHLLHELEVGQTYEIVTTGFNGLYRYRIGDRFTVDSRDSEDVPRLEFTGRGGTSSFTSEKITEQQVIRAMTMAAKKTGIAVAQFACFPRWNDPPFYTFVIEPAQDARVPGALSFEELARELEVNMSSLNSNYADKRSSGRLGPVTLEVVSPGSFARLRDRTIATGVSPTQYKESVFHRNDKLLEFLVPPQKS